MVVLAPPSLKKRVVVVDVVAKGKKGACVEVAGRGKDL